MLLYIPMENAFKVFFPSESFLKPTRLLLTDPSESSEDSVTTQRHSPDGATGGRRQSVGDTHAGTDNPVPAVPGPRRLSVREKAAAFLEASQRKDSNC